MKRLLLALCLCLLVFPFASAYYCNPALATGVPGGCSLTPVQYGQEIQYLMNAAHTDTNCVVFKYYVIGSNTVQYTGGARGVTSGVLNTSYVVENKYGVSGINIVSVDSEKCTAGPNYCYDGCPGFGYGALAGNPANGWWWNMTAGIYSVPVANFTGSPLLGEGPLNVTFTDTSMNASVYNWSVSPAGGWYLTAGTINSQNIGVNFVTSGNYTITHGVSNALGSDIETKTNYIWVYNSTSTTTTSFRTINYYDGGTIHNTTINLYDVQNTSWSNITQSATGQGSITTLAGHTINAYASGWGWMDADLLGTVADGLYHSILMRPAGAAGFNVSAGRVTLLITAYADDNADLLENVKLSVLIDGGGTWIGYTNAAGSQYLNVTNNTDIRITATKVGFGDATVFDNTGPGNGGSATKVVSITMIRSFVTPTAVITTLPGGGLPTVAPTVDPYPCIGDGSYQDTLNCQRKQGEMGADLIAYGPQLVQFFIMLTFVGGIGLMLKLGK